MCNEIFDSCRCHFGVKVSIFQASLSMHGKFIAFFLSLSCSYRLAFFLSSGPCLLLFCQDAQRGICDVGSSS